MTQASPSLPDPARPADVMLALESIRDAFYIVDAGWRIVYFNGCAERHFGLARAQVLGRTVWEAFPGAAGSAFAPAFRSAMRDRVPARVEARSVTGDERWVEVEAVPCGDGLGLQVRDVTERRRALEALAAGEQTLRFALEAARLGLFEWTLPAGPVAWSPRAREILGLPAGEAAPELRRRLVHPDDRARVAAARLRALERRGDGRLRIEHRIVMADGEVRWISVHGQRIDGPGAGARLIGVIEDITARRQAAVRRREREERLEDEGRRKDEFLAMLAHELRNPLAPLTTVLHLLGRSAALGARERGLLEVAERQRARLARLVDDLLDVSRIGRGKIELRPAPITLQAVLRDAVDAVADAFRARRQRLDVDLPEAPVELVADAARIAQIVGNLLDNAGKYTDAGGRVRLVAREDAQGATIVVSDDGIGIEPAELPRLFEPFEQVDAGADRAHGGLGIGLALVRRLTELHGGAVDAHSDGPGRGARFTVRLPRRPPAPG